MRAGRVRLQWPARIALAGGALYGVLLAVLAATVRISGSESTSTSAVPGTAGGAPVETTVIRHSAQTLIGQNGFKVLWLVLLVPLAVVGLVYAELRWCRRWGHPGPGGLTILLTAALGLLVLAGAFSIGPAVVPLLAAVVVAAASEAASRQPPIYLPAPVPPPPPPVGVSRPAPWVGSAPR